MKNKIIMLLLLIIMVISCSPVSWSIIGNGDNMKNEFKCDFNEMQFDSVCNANNIDSDLNKWVTLPLNDNETNEKNEKYMFIQKMDSLEIIYTVIKKGNKFNLNKRITY